MESAELAAWKHRPPCPDCGRLPAIMNGGAGKPYTYAHLYGCATEWDMRGKVVTKNQSPRRHP